MDYEKELKSEIKRLEQIEKFDKKRKESKDLKKQNYYLEGMKCLLIERETVDNYQDILNSYRNIMSNNKERIDKLFDEIKAIKKLKI